MPKWQYKTQLPMKKLYYSIGEVSTLTGVDTHRIRYWEEKIPQLQPVKSSNAKRLFREEDVNLILKLKELIIEKKFSTKGALQAIEGKKSSSSKVKKSARLEKDLRSIRSFLVELRDQI